MKIFLNLIIISFIASFSSNLFAQKVFINEVMASNLSSIKDPDFMAFGDWIEVFNPQDSSLNLKGYYITDDLKNNKKYKISSDLLIPSKGFALIWADDKDTLNHANFKLSSSGETIGLFDSLGALVDSVTFGSQPSDISFGRFPDGGPDWARFSPSTPGSINLEKNIFAKLSLPSFSVQGGFYPGAITVSLSHPEAGTTIRYTLNGKTPTANSPAYSTPLRLDSTTALSVRAFKDGFLPSTTSVNTYFINFQCDLPVFSIVSDPDNFFSDTLGIYVVGTRGIPGNCISTPRNWNQDWERPVNLEFYEKDKSLQFNLQAGVKIYGGCTRKYDMKSLAFYFRSSYGYDKLRYRLFPGYPIVEYNSFLLKTSGQDWYRTLFRDGMIHTLVKQGMNVDYLEYRPSVAFINGQYWGVHNIGEKLGEDYLKSRFGVDPDSIDIIDPGPTGEAQNGNISAYRTLVNFYSSNSLASEENYNYIKSILDVDEFIDYYIAEIYVANGDWPSNNMKIWRQRSSNGKWRWLLYDTDCSFGGNSEGLYNTNTLEQATAPDSKKGINPPWATLLLRKLLENNNFKNEFIQRFAVHMATTFEKDHVIHVIDSISTKIASEIPRHKSRWVNSISMGNDWAANVEVLRDFASKRQVQIRSHFYTKFAIPGAYSMTLSRNNPAWGKIIAHSIEIKNNGAFLILFKSIPFIVKALPLPGYRFVRWEGASTSQSQEIVLNPDVNSVLTAIFEPENNSTSGSVVINEINYKSASSFDTDDWIELYNPSANPLDISGFKVQKKKPEDIFVFPDSTTIDGHGYLVLCCDSLKFRSFQLSKIKISGNLPFGLDSQGDLLRLFDKSGSLIDSVKYGTSGEWTSMPNGTGASLSLINPASDNSIAKNWMASKLYGTPGKLNDTYTTGLQKNDPEVPKDFHLFDNYPNPFNNSTVISFSIPERVHLTLRIYDILGREVAKLLDEVKDAGIYRVPFSMQTGSGIYIYVLQAGGNIQSKKMLLLR
ncbi:MAG: CotH kinase family protein [Bacteroidota bacterium]|nr:CotH kinase family protein [Bacteroidota bacterium]